MAPASRQAHRRHAWRKKRIDRGGRRRRILRSARNDGWRGLAAGWQGRWGVGAVGTLIPVWQRERDGEGIAGGDRTADGRARRGAGGGGAPRPVRRPAPFRRGDRLSALPTRSSSITNASPRSAQQRAPRSRPRTEPVGPRGQAWAGPPSPTGPPHEPSRWTTLLPAAVGPRPTVAPPPIGARPGGSTVR